MRRIDRHLIGTRVGSYFKGNPERGMSSAAKVEYIETVRVYQSGHKGRCVALYVETMDGKNLPIIELSGAAALAVAEAIIEQLPDITVACSLVREALVKLVADKAQRVAEESQAVVESVLNRAPEHPSRVDEDMATGRYGAPCDPKRFGE